MILPAADAATFLRALANLVERNEVVIERHDMQPRGILLSLLEPEPATPPPSPPATKPRRRATRPR